MIQNTNLMTIADTIGGYVKSNTDVSEFVYEQFGTNELNVIVGEMLHRQVPTVSETPYVVFTDWKKREGTDIEFAKYTCTMVIGVGKGAREEFVETDNGVFVLDAYDVSNEFAQLIIDVLNNRDNKRRPLSSYEFQGSFPVDTDGGHWCTIVNLTWRIYQTMGANQEEF